MMLLSRRFCGSCVCVVSSLVRHSQALQANPHHVLKVCQNLTNITAEQKWSLVLQHCKPSHITFLICGLGSQLSPAFAKSFANLCLVTKLFQICNRFRRGLQPTWFRSQRSKNDSTKKEDAKIKACHQNIMNVDRDKSTLTQGPWVEANKGTLAMKTLETELRWPWRTGHTVPNKTSFLHITAIASSNSTDKLLSSDSVFLLCNRCEPILATSWVTNQSLWTFKSFCGPPTITVWRLAFFAPTRRASD